MNFNLGSISSVFMNLDYFKSVFTNIVSFNLGFIKDLFMDSSLINVSFNLGSLRGGCL
ncbi:hypothetical protein [Methanobrevibacter sp. 87.7]|uniref:hypothetical protein n=1 Tax=Methanobrevibacter sp. 87.7 TaxID=387957 RepID=UPI001303B5F2|nr:hypothetical protein [Methanobrevibacter sp. 87.7]